MYEIFYDYDDGEFYTTLKEEVKNEEEAKRIADNLREYNYYSNIQIVYVRG